MVLARARRASVLLLVVSLACLVASCGGGAADEISTGGDPTPTPAPSTSGPEATASTTVAAEPAATTPGVGETTTPPASTSSTTTPVGSDPSPVEGLTAGELRAALDAPVGSSVRSAPGPTAERVALPDGTRVWRVRIPGDFPVRAARVQVLVAGETVGEGVVGSDLGSLTAVAPDGVPLRTGDPVAYRWDGGTEIAVGRLVVVR